MTPGGCPMHAVPGVPSAAAPAADDAAHAFGHTAAAGPIRFLAYPYRRDDGWTIEAPGPRREWMEETLGKAALRCLPLAMANQAGWIVKLPFSLRVKWTQRKAEAKFTELHFPTDADRAYAGNVKTNFGTGIVTFALPWVFRTSPGIGLWVHGPPNTPIYNLAPLEGLVETDWSPYPFTMNWKIIKPKVEVWFRKGDPICMLTPFPLDLLDRVEPAIRPIQNDVKLAENVLKAGDMRAETEETGRTLRGEFELNYMRGYLPDGGKAPMHRSNFKLAPFDA